MSAKKVKAPAVSYAKAMEELESILADLEDENVEVDELAAKVKRASELIQFCRDRLTTTRVEIEQVVAELESLDEEDVAADEDGEERP